MVSYSSMDSALYFKCYSIKIQYLIFDYSVNHMTLRSRVCIIYPYSDSLSQ